MGMNKERNTQQSKVKVQPYRPMAVSGDWLDWTPIPAYSNGDLWNGWQQPLFPKSSVQQIELLMPGEVRFDEAEGLVRIFEDANDAEPVFASRALQIEVDGQSMEVFIIGTGAFGPGWCWVDVGNDTDTEAEKMEGQNQPASTGKVFIEAFACDENGDGPEWAELHNPAAVLDRIRELQVLIVEHKLSEVRVFMAPDVWGPAGVEGDLQLSGDELVVTTDSFWFTCFPSNQDYICETRAQDIESFATALTTCEGGAVYLSVNPEGMANRIEEHAEVAKLKLASSKAGTSS
ncbi:hypothetical protein [Ralstonia pseudosolanacearum]|uniref:hypothetical protein n=1 Tax=Ralstonia pseudosolanacearum TaxID=1310165 RepID=UPI003CE6F052